MDVGFSPEGPVQDQTDAVRRGPDTCHLRLTVMDKVDFVRTVVLGLCQVWTLTLYGLRTEDIRESVQGLRSTLKLLMSTTAEQMDTLTTNRTDRQDQKTKPLRPLYTESMRMPVPTTLWIWPCARLLGPTKGQGREIVYTLGICSFGGFWDCCLFSGRKELVVLCITVHLSIL